MSHIALKGHYKIDTLTMVCLFCPFRAFNVVIDAYPGRRSALPWADMLKPVGLKSPSVDQSNARVYASELNDESNLALDRHSGDRLAGRLDLLSRNV